MKPLLCVWFAAVATLGAGCLTSRTSVPNASYAGAYQGVENNLSPRDLQSDIRAAYSFKAKKYPNGFVTIYGSSRIKESNPAGPMQDANDKLYRDIMTFASAWTKSHGFKYPIMTGAGPGLMEAGSRGAFEAGGPSIGYTTYYGSATQNGGQPNLAFNRYVSPDGRTTNHIVTDGLIFSSVAVRESMMILHSAAMVLAPGGTGTEWEIFQILETIKSAQLNPVPVFIFGDRATHWASFDQRLADMVKRGTIKEGEVTQLFQYIDDPMKLHASLQKALALP